MNLTSSLLLYGFICFMGTFACRPYQNEPARKEAVKPKPQTLARKLPPQAKSIDVPQEALNLKTTDDLCFLIKESVKGFHRTYLQGVALLELDSCAVDRAQEVQNQIFIWAHYDFRLERQNHKLDFRLKIQHQGQTAVLLKQLDEEGEEMSWEVDKQERILSSNVSHLEPSLKQFLTKALTHAD